MRGSELARSARTRRRRRGKQKAWQSRQTFVRNTRRLRLGPTAVRQPNQPGYAQPRLLLIQTRHFIRACAVCLPCATSSTGRGSCTMAVADRAIRPRGPFLLLPLHSAGPLFPTTRAEQQASTGVTSSLSSSFLFPLVHPFSLPCLKLPPSMVHVARRGARTRWGICNSDNNCFWRSIFGVEGCGFRSWF